MNKNNPLYIVLFILPFFSLWSCTAQIKSGIIDYNIHLAPNEEGVSMEEAFSKGAKVYFNAGYVKLVQNDKKIQDEFTITRLNSREELTYLEVMDRKFAVIFDKKYLPKIGDLTSTDEYKTIAGYKCQKFIAPMGDGTMHLYLTKEISTSYAPYIKTNGFALEYSLAMSYGQLTYTAQNVASKKLNDQDILPPSEYEEVTIDAFNDFMMSMMGGSEKTGSKAPDFSKKSLNGDLINLSELKDQVVVINFWFTKCAPCKAEIPQLNELKSEFKQEKVKFLAITFDDQSMVSAFLQKHPFHFEQIVDASEITNDYQVRAFPTTIILDKNGNIAHQKTGGSPNIKDELKILILEELGIDKK